MRKNLLLAIVCVLGLLGNLNAQKTVTIGTQGDSYSYSESSDLPYNNSWCYSASQQIYLGSELGIEDAATIESIAFKSATENTHENYIQVYMVNHKNNNFTDSLKWIPVTENDKVYEGYFTASGDGQWSNIKLNTPFVCRPDNNLVVCVNICYEYELSRNDQDAFYTFAKTEENAYSCALRSNSRIDVTKVNKDTFKDENTGTLGKDRNQIKLVYSQTGGINVNLKSIDFGNIALGEYWNEKTEDAVVVKISSYDSYITSVTCSDTSFFKLPEVECGESVQLVQFVLSYDKNAAAGEKTAEITITDSYDEKVVIPVKANVYETVSPDVFELAKEITFTDGKFTDEPDSTKLYDDYLLPNERLDSYAPDAVYTLELEEESLVLVDIEGTNAKFALYDEKFNGKEGPSFDNAVTGRENIISTAFSYDFEDTKLDDFVIEDYDEYKDYTWKVENGCLISHSYYGWGEGEGDDLVWKYINKADERIITKEAYAITPNTVLTFDVKFMDLNGMGVFDDINIQVANDKDTIDIAYIQNIFDINAPGCCSVDWQAKKVHIGTKFTELGLDYGNYHIVLYHKNNGAGTTWIDNLKLTERTTVIPAGKYYLVAAAEDAFKLTVTLDEPKDEEPVVPENLVANALSTSSIILTWDNVENALSYNVYRNSEMIINVTNTNYTDNNLEYNTEYCYTVTAVRNETESDKSEEVCATTFDLPITTPKNLVAEALSTSSIELTWNEVENALIYNVYQANELIANIEETTFTVDGLEYNTEYCYTVTAVRNETETDKSEEVCAKTFDLPITTPENLVAEALSTSSISLTWDAVENALSYNVYSGENKIANVIENTYIVNELNYYTDYCFTVTAVRNETESDKSEEKCAKTFDLPITTPENLIANVLSTSSIILTWDNVENALSYNLYRDGEMIINVTNTNYTDNNLEYNTEYCYTVTAVRNETESYKSEEKCAKTFDLPITTPENLVAEALSTSSIELTWNEVENALSYNVYQANELIANIEETTFTVDGLEYNTEYCYTVTAVRNETESDKSEEVCATTFDLPITTPKNLVANVLSTSSIILTWDNVENALSYNLYRDGKMIINVTNTNYTDNNLEYNTEYCYTVTAVRNETESDKSEEKCAKTLGESIEELSSSINIYPNPVENDLFITTEMNVEEIAIYDVYGRHTMSQQVNETTSQQVVDVTDLEAGVYFVNIKTENGNVVKRFVKK